MFSGTGIALTFIASLAILLFARSFSAQILWDVSHLTIGAKDAAAIALLVIITMCFHEAAHAMSCRFYGGVIPWMGIILYFFVPCPFCDVSDMYMMKERRRRLWVSLSGIAANMITGNIVLLIYCIQAWKGTPVSWLLYFWIGNTLTIVFNFIPLVKLDGYWMLSALTGTTNLMDKALDRVRYLFTGNRSGQTQGPGAFLIIYGGLVLLFRPAFWGFSIYSVRGLLLNLGLDARAVMILTLAASLAAVMDEVRFMIRVIKGRNTEGI